MIVATFPAQVVATGPGDGYDRRTIAGVAVPWNVEGTVRDGTRVRFLPGSLDPAALPIAVLGHEGPPIGRVANATGHPDRLEAAVRVSATHAGDDALVLAADGVLTMFSVGANPTDWRYDDHGVLEVAAADWIHLSLETTGAFTGADVTTVTATQGAATMSDEPVPDVPDEPEPEPEQPDPEIIEGARPRPVSPSPSVVPLRAGAIATAQRPAGLRAAADVISRGLRTNRGAPSVQAALADLTTNDAAGFVRPAFRSEIVGLIDHGMPIVNVLDQRALPPTGMSIDYPVWETLPTYTEIQSRGLNNTTGVPPAPGEKTEIGTGESKIGVASDEIEVWAQGADISFQLADRSSPSFIEAWLRACAVDAATKYDTYVGERLLAGATAATAGTDFLGNVKALFAALAPPAKVPLGPLFLAMSYDVWLDTIDVTEMNGPAYWDMSINLGAFLPTSDTPFTTFVDPNLPAGTMLLGSRNAAANYGGPSTTANIRVVDVSLLGYNIGVYFYATPAVEYPQGFAKLTGLTGAATTTSTSRSKSSS